MLLTVSVKVTVVFASLITVVFTVPVVVVSVNDSTEPLDILFKLLLRLFSNHSSNSLS